MIWEKGKCWQKRLEQGGADRQEPQKGQELKPPVLILITIQLKRK